MLEAGQQAGIKNREYLLTEITPYKTGFTPRPLERLASKRYPTSKLSIECNHLLRTNRENSFHGHQNIEYQLWLEAGKHDPPYPKQLDKAYDSNTWRNFKGNYNFTISSKGRSTKESIAASYPVLMPKPSKVGDYSYDRFLRETPSLIRDTTIREIAIERTTLDKNMMELLKLRTNCRNPPIDKNGSIQPPEHYKKHPHYFKPIADLPTTEYLVEQMKKAPPTPYGYHESPKKYTPTKSPAWRFNLKSTNKHYQRAATEIRQHQSYSNSNRETESRVKTCTPATSTIASD